MMCAFMTPVLKNDWEIYNTKRSRNNSESSAITAPSHPHSRPSSSHSSKRRGIGEAGRSHSYHAPHHHGKGENLGILVGSPPRAYHLSTKTSRCASRTSMEPHSPGTTSPPISPLAVQTTSSAPTHGPTKSPSSLSLTKFHSKVMDKLKNVLHLKDDNSQEEEQEGSRGQS